MQTPLATRPHRPLALIGAGLRDSLHRQSLHLAAGAVSARPRQARVDDMAHTGTVSEVSATLVASTILGRRCGAKTLFCSSAVRRA